MWLLFTGGEIFARKDFLDIYTHAKKRGLLITLFTNGTQITPAIADYLAAWRPFAIEITLYGRTRETYERLTRVPGSFDRCMRGIRLLKERGLPLKLKSVAVTINQHEMQDMQRFAEEEIGVPFKFDGMINARIDCSHSPLDVRLSPADMVRLDSEDPARRAEWAQPVAEHPGAPEAPASDQMYHCGGGVSAFAIDPEGKLSICVLSQQDSYDVRAGNFKDGWDGFMRGDAGQEGHAAEQVHELQVAGAVLQLRRHRRARKRRRRGAGGVLLRGRPPACPGAGVRAAGAR